MDLSMSPNYVGPFAIRNVWGEVRLPSPTFTTDPELDVDPLGMKRVRGVSTGVIQVPENSLFDLGGVNYTMLPYSGTTITGAAYWYFNDTTPIAPSDSDDEEGTPFNVITDNSTDWLVGNMSIPKIQTPTPMEVQQSEEGTGSELMVLGAWGNVRVTFDGT